MNQPPTPWAITADDRQQRAPHAAGASGEHTQPQAARFARGDNLRRLVMNRNPILEALEERLQFAVTAVFIPAAGALSVFGDSLDNTIVVSRNAAGRILVNGGNVAVLGGTPTVANTAIIQVFGQDGNDVLRLDEASGALPRANLFGGAGNDALTGGSGADLLFGQSGNDVLLGKGGDDFLFGGADNDALTGGTGDDQAFG